MIKTTTKNIINQKNNFEEKGKKICNEHKEQKVADVEYLNDKYEKKTIFEKNINTWEAIQKLSQVCDTTDPDLYCVSQWVHTLQVVEAMEINKVKDEMMFVAGWVHDLGKLLLATDEDPMNVVCTNYVIQGEERSGLDNCVLHWNHDEFVFIKLKNMMPYEYLWLIRYHSIEMRLCETYFNDNDKRLVEKFLIPFKNYDKKSKSIFNFPKLNLDYYRKIIEKNIKNINL